MKKFVPILVVIVLVLSVVGIARLNPVWASPKSSAGIKSPLKTLITVTKNGNYNVGGVCTIDVNFKSSGLQMVADAEVPIDQSKLVSYSGDGHLLFPGCHFVFSNAGAAVSPLGTDAGSVKVCFGASPEFQMVINYYLDGASNPVWASLPTTLEDNGELACAPALYNGVYMPSGKLVPPPGSEVAGANAFFPNSVGGTVLPPPANITITGSGTYAVGGVCLITASYNTTGLSDTVQVEYPTDLKNHFTEDTKTVPFNDYTNGSLFYFPGCHVVHYKNQTIQDTMNSPQDGDWQICFAAIPDKTMTIYYYLDDTQKPIAQPTVWTSLVTTTAKGISCADLVNFSAVYAPAGK
jgi:hypothetical protein